MRKIHFSTIISLVLCFIGWVFCLLTPKIDFIVYVMQMRLEELGYDPGPIDGMIGEEITDAIRKLQHDHDLPVTGKLDEKTLEKLSSSPQTEEKEIQIIGKAGECVDGVCDLGTCEYGDGLVFTMKDGI